MARSKTPTADLLIHPVRWRVIQRLMGRERTTAQLREDLPDVAPTTLYRHVAALLDGGVLTVVKEERIRGTVERTFTLNRLESQRVGAEESKAMSEEQHRTSLTLLLAQVAGDFDRFLERGELRTRDDELSYGQVALYVSAEELPQLSADLMRVLGRYLEQPEGERKPRIMFTTIAIPDD